MEIVGENLSNSLTGVLCKNSSAIEIVTKLKEDYNIWVNPNSGDFADKMFRVGHIGDLTIEDNTKLINALIDLNKRGILQ